MPPRILIAGYYGYGNLGDEAILDGLLAGFRRQDPSLHFTVVGGDLAAVERDHHVPAVLWQDIDGLIDAITESDLVILGGGGLFHDYWAVDPGTKLTPFHEGLARYSAIPLISSLADRPCMILGVGVGPLRTEQSQEMTRSCFDLASGWTVRDKDSLAWLERAGAEVKRGSPGDLVSADPSVLLDEPIGQSDDSLEELLGLPNERDYILVAIRPWELANPDRLWEAEVADALDRIAQSRDLRPIFVPLQTGQNAANTDDRNVARQIIGRMRLGHESVLLEGPVDRRQLRVLIDGSTVVLAMRMHAALFACIQGKPCVSLTYDPKVASTMDLFGRSALALSGTDWTSEKIVEMVARSVQMGPPDNLKARVIALRSDAEREVRIALDLMGKERPPLERSEATLRREGLVAVRRLARLQPQLDRISALEDQRLTLMVQRNQLLNEARALRESLGGRVMQLYWNLAMRLLPEGSRRKEAYRFLMGIVKGSGPALSSAVRVGEVDQFLPSSPMKTQRAVTISSQRIVASGDPMVDFLVFQDQVRQQGFDKAFVIVTTTPLRKSEGQRGTQLALQLASRNVAVVYAWWRWDPGERVAQDRLGDGIFELPIDILEAHYADVLSSFRGLERVLLMEFPPPSLFGALSRAHALGWTVVYDVIDDWSAFKKVGQAPWYDRLFEKHLLLTADAVTVVSPQLRGWASSEGREDALLVPNASLRGIAEVRQDEMLDRGEVTLGYFGHLSPAWVDWNLVRRLANENPSWILYFIGYGEDVTDWAFPHNVVMLGKQPQDLLASFARRWDVGIIPFRKGPLALAADPIKVYEYFAMGLPIVMSGTPPPPGTEDLLEIAADSKEFAQAVIRAIRTRESLASSRQAFARKNTWSGRADSLLGMLARGDQRIGEKDELFGR